ncbi:thiamine-phosphate kinase [Promicromonospora thailandica]|uniref:Thiamine-monophosphate kinase n=1 Tax=Promicromonospora thailandica TaxID=765201 RepID=A0A9X2JXN4_9MICO|nr:thiamine-phosphate kinase [Promicromonospora thailandica]MCP2264334.1 thiamine-monophosphate kinase [Promicromonospora thailandica]BFF20976.1 thiamine-phosphate kinase [Promicromonospora thailandica]
MTLVRDLSEEQILDRIVPLLPRGSSTLVGPGDDAAVLAAPDGRYVVSTDVLVEDRHFRTRWSTGYDVGRRAAAQNLADVAAMGARPTALVTSLVVPGETELDWVTGLARGLADGCAPVGAGAVGGDLAGGPLLVVSITVHGDLEGRAPVLRSGARPGDVVAHAGVRGWSAAGLALLEAGLVRAPLAAVPLEVADGVVLEDAWERLVAAHLRPDPPLAAGTAAAVAGATAMLDVSDGLLRDAGRVARASGVRIDLDPAAFAADRDTLRSAARAVAAAAGLGDPGWGPGRADIDGLTDTWVWSGGEDHGLLATFPAGTALPAGWSAVGRVLEAGESAPAARVTIGGAAPAVTPGWDHFRA